MVHLLVAYSTNAGEAGLVTVPAADAAESPDFIGGRGVRFAMVGIISAEEFQRVIAERDARFEVVDRIRRRLPHVPDTQVQHDVREALSKARRRRRA